MFKKSLYILRQVIIWVIILVMALFILISLSTKNSSLPQLFGTSMLTVQSNSMNGKEKGDFKKGDLIFIKQLNLQGKKDLKVGDIITFNDIIENKKVYNTHRIVKIDNVGGILSFTTKGDANSTQDTEKRLVSDIVGIYQNKKISNAGSIFSFVQSKWGFFFCLVVPLFLFFLWRLFKLWAAILQYKSLDDASDICSNINKYN